jgi:hypothetical protein
VNGCQEPANPVITQIAYFLGNQAVTEAELSAPHLNHVSCSGTLAPHPYAAAHD